MLFYYNMVTMDPCFCLKFTSKTILQIKSRPKPNVIKLK